MKSIVKIGIALSCILFLLGAVGVGIGMAMGVKPSQLLHSGRNFNPFATHNVQENLADLPGELPDLSSPLGNNPSQGEEYYEFQNIRKLDLQLEFCDLHILSHEEDFIAVCADNVQNYFKCNQKGDTLILQDRRPSSTKSNSMEHALILDLYLPEQEFDEFCLDLGAGYLTLDLLSADNIEIESDISNITIQSLSCRELDIESGVGEFQADSILTSNEAEIRLGTGNLTISAFDGKHLELNCGMGNASVIAVGREDDYNYQLEAALGSIYLNHHIQESYEDHHEPFHDSHEDNGVLDIDHGAERSIQILCALGNAELNFTEE